MSRASHWLSNGDNSSPNEEKLLGERVVVRQGRKEWCGTLHMIRAHTRGNKTLAVGRMPIWMLRNKPFTIEAVQS